MVVKLRLSIRTFHERSWQDPPRDAFFLCDIMVIGDASAPPESRNAKVIESSKLSHVATPMTVQNICLVSVSPTMLTRASAGTTPAYATLLLDNTPR